MDGQLPHPRNWVVVAPGTTYTVPEGKLFVPTALGATLDTPSSVVLQVDGAYALKCRTNLNGLSTTTVAVPPGYFVRSGATLSTSHANGQAWGYLVNE